MLRIMNVVTNATDPITKSFPNLVVSHKLPFEVFIFRSMNQRITDPSGKFGGVIGSFVGKGTLALHMFLVRPTATWHVHPFCQQSMSCHEFPAFRNWVFLIINKTNTTTPYHSKPWIVFLHQFLHHWKPPCLT